MTEEPPEDQPRLPRQRPSRIDVGGWMSSIFGSGRGDTGGDEDVPEEIKDVEPETEKEVLFATGFIVRDVDPGTRRAARERYLEEYGKELPSGRRGMTNEEWNRWRDLMGYND